MYIDLVTICFSLAAFGLICMGLTFAKAIVDVYVLKKCSCEKEYDGSCIGGHQEHY